MTTEPEVLPPTAMVATNGSRPSAGESERQEFGAMERRTSAEMATAAAAAAAKAAVEARYVMAIQRPRDQFKVREKLLADCRREGFAKVAWYSKPVGGDAVEGPSIRFAEAFIRAWTNVLTEVAVTYDDDERRTVRVSVTDLETNVSYPKDISIQKRVERRKANPGQKVYGQRINSQGKVVYLVEATEDDLANKEAALVSKAIRTGALRLCPGDLLDECVGRIFATREGEVNKDLGQAIKATVDSYATKGIGVDHLAKYLGHSVSEATSAEVLELRSVFNAIVEKEGTWADALDAKLSARAPSPAKAAPEPAPTSAPAGRAEELKAKAKAATKAQPMSADDPGAEKEEF